LAKARCVRCGNSKLTHFSEDGDSAYCGRCGARTATKEGYKKKYGKTLAQQIKDLNKPENKYRLKFD